MNLFEFLMILLSLIVGLGLAEILSGFANHLKRNGFRELSWPHAVITLTVFLGLLQHFWEAWGLRFVGVWTFPMMLMMLGSPICLYLIAHVLFPERGESANLGDYYLDRAPLVWPLAGLTVIIGTAFRPIAFGDPLWISDNASGVLILAVCAILTVAKSRMLHNVLVPLVFAAVLLDVLTFSHSIG
ncbi:MAG: hypothetical protein QNI99_17005 [Woeseiaceae bacterium]|nr:hypothetical protein [Woeseiaceae bacterium]